MRLKIDISGQKNIIDNLKKFGEDGEIISNKLLKIKSQEITLKAIEKAPVDIGNLRANIVNEEIAPLEYQITAKAYYSAYMEFGTGKQVDVPQEFNAMALQFKGKGKGDFEDGLKHIEIWCKHKGIPVEMAYPIFMSILKKGLKPRPFMHPSFLYGKRTYKKDMLFAWQKLIKKYNE